MFKYIKIFGTIFILMIVIIIVAIFCILKNTTVRTTKDYAVMYVDVEDIVDAEAMISPPEKYSQLLQIDLDMRKKVANYMEKNNLKLKSGKQRFVRIYPTLDELIDDGFEFEKMRDDK